MTDEEAQKEWILALMNDPGLVCITSSVGWPGRRDGPAHRIACVHATSCPIKSNQLP